MGHRDLRSFITAWQEPRLERETTAPRWANDIVMPKVTILTFHGIGPFPPSVDNSERDVWIHLDEFKRILDVVASRDDVRITFDDGNESDVQLALPVLIERGLRAEFFLVAGRLGQPGYIGCADVASLIEARMTIGSHGMAHRSWRRLTEPDLHEELVGARDALSTLMGTRIHRAACPFGAYDRRVLGHLRRMGYTRVYSSDGGRAQSAAWLQPRNTVRSHDNASTIERLIDEPQPFIRMIARKTKLFLKRLR